MRRTTWGEIRHGLSVMAFDARFGQRVVPLTSSSISASIAASSLDWLLRLMRMVFTRQVLDTCNPLGHAILQTLSGRVKPLQPGV